MLTAKQCQAAKATGKPYDIRDGRHGLALRISAKGSATWLQRISIRGTRTNVGLGPLALVPLAKAREAALRNLQIVREGGDPRKPQGITFAEAFAEVQREREGTVTAKVAHDWEASIHNHCTGLLAKPVAGIGKHDIRQTLMPLRTTPTQMGNVARRISSVMEWAIVNDHRNDADYTALVLKSIPPSACRTVSHSAQALPWTEISQTVALVNSTNCKPSAKAAFAFLVLTAGRTSEVLGARWSEVDMASRTWTVPAERMKMRLEHRVPLSQAAIKVLEAQKRRSSGVWVFGGRNGRLNEKAIRNALTSAKVNTVGHSFRTTFSDWCRESGVLADVRERALAHGETNKVQAAYINSDMLDQRRVVMEAYAKAVTKPPAGRLPGL